MIDACYVNKKFPSTDCSFLETRREKHLAIMISFTCHDCQHVVDEQGVECQSFGSEIQGTSPKEDLLNSLHVARNMMDYQNRSCSFSKAGVYLSYLSCPGWWLSAFLMRSFKYKLEMCAGQKGRGRFKKPKLKNLWRRVTVTVRSSGMGSKKL